MASIITMPNGSGQSTGRTGFAEKLGFAALVDLSDEFHTWLLQHRLDLLAEIGFVDAPEEKMKNCHYINMQLERIQEAKVGAAGRLSSSGAVELEEQLQAMESAISRIRNEMWKQENSPLALAPKGGNRSIFIIGDGRQASVAERPVALPPENQGAIRHATAIPTTTAAVR